MFNLDEFANRLRAVRKERRLNQSAFAALGGVGLQTQSRYENGETEPQVRYLAALAEAGIDVAFVLTGKPSKVFDDINSALENLKPEQAAAIRTIVIAMAGANFVVEDRPMFPKGGVLHDHRPAFRSESDE